MNKLIIMVFLLQGCTFYNPFTPLEVDKVTVVKYSPYLREHRAFISRTHLKILDNNKKYLFFYKKDTNDIAVLVQRKNTFFLYTLSNPKEKIYTLMTLRQEGHLYALKHFKSMGYEILSSPASKGYILTVSYKRYKGIKTLLFESKDYTRLLHLYRQAISKYRFNIIKKIQTPLPKSLILGYYRQYRKKTTDPKKLRELNKIAKKLQIKIPQPSQKKVQSSTLTPKKTEQKIIPKEREEEEIQSKKKSASWYDFAINQTEKQQTALPYTYYLHKASLDELESYLSKDSTQKSVSASAYKALLRKKEHLQEQCLLKEGSLEELIAAYKRNKNPVFKARIFSLIREKQLK